MDNKELLQDAKKEIIQLRRDNSIYAARLQMFDDMMLVFRTQPSWGGSVRSGGEDVVWRIDNLIRDMEAGATSGK